VTPVQSEVGASTDVELVVRQVVDSGAHDRIEVAKHPGDGLPRPSEDQVDAHGEPEVSAPRDRLEDLGGLLLTPAHGDHLVVELLYADADSGAARRSHRVELLPREKLRDAFERDLGVAAKVRKKVADEL